MVKLQFYNPALPQSITDFGRKFMKSNLIDISAELRHETDKAYLIWDGRMEEEVGGKNKKELRIWVPKTMVAYDGKGEFTMPEWLALDKGFI